jgi:hypothetical protein
MRTDFLAITDAVGLAETYAEDGAPVSARANLLKARAMIDAALRGAPAGFFQPGKTYLYGGGITAPELVVRFSVEHVMLHPERGLWRAVGWQLSGGPDAKWHGHFYDEDEAEGWQLDASEDAPTPRPLEIPPFLAQMMAESKRLADDLTLTGRDLVAARARDAAREVARGAVGELLPEGLSEDQAHEIADRIAAPVVAHLRQYHQANEYLANGRDHFGARAAVAERKLELIQKSIAEWGLPEEAAEELRKIITSEDGRTV